MAYTDIKFSLMAVILLGACVSSTDDASESDSADSDDKANSPSSPNYERDIHCDTFASCGGKPTGNWHIVDTCFRPVTQSVSCGEVTVAAVNQTGSIEFRAEGTLKTIQNSTSTLNYIFPESCLGSADPSICEDLGDQLLDSLESTDATGTIDCAFNLGQCACELEEAIAAEFPGSWSVEGTQLTVSYDVGDEFIGVSKNTVEFCVEGDVLSLRTLGPPGQETIQVLHRD